MSVTNEKKRTPYRGAIDASAERGLCLCCLDILYPPIEGRPTVTWCEECKAAGCQNNTKTACKAGKTEKSAFRAWGRVQGAWHTDGRWGKEYFRSWKVAQEGEYRDVPILEFEATVYDPGTASTNNPLTIHAGFTSSGLVVVSTANPAHATLPVEPDVVQVAIMSLFDAYNLMITAIQTVRAENRYSFRALYTPTMNEVPSRLLYYGALPDIMRTLAAHPAYAPRLLVNPTAAGVADLVGQTYVQGMLLLPKGEDPYRKSDPGLLIESYDVTGVKLIAAQSTQARMMLREIASVANQVQLAAQHETITLDKQADYLDLLRTAHHAALNAL